MVFLKMDCKNTIYSANKSTNQKKEKRQFRVCRFPYENDAIAAYFSVNNFLLIV